MFRRRKTATADGDTAIDPAAAQRVDDIWRALMLLWAGLVLSLLLSAPLFLKA